MPVLETLPEEILLIVLGWLPLETCGRLLQASKVLQSLGAAYKPFKIVTTFRNFLLEGDYESAEPEEEDEVESFGTSSAPGWAAFANGVLVFNEGDPDTDDSPEGEQLEDILTSPGETAVEKASAPAPSLEAIRARLEGAKYSPELPQGWTCLYKRSRELEQSESAAEDIIVLQIPRPGATALVLRYEQGSGYIRRYQEVDHYLSISIDQDDGKGILQIASVLKEHPTDSLRYRKMALDESMQQRFGLGTTEVWDLIRKVFTEDPFQKLEAFDVFREVLSMDVDGVAVPYVPRGTRGGRTSYEVATIAAVHDLEQHRKETWFEAVREGMLFELAQLQGRVQMKNTLPRAFELLNNSDADPQRKYDSPPRFKDCKDALEKALPGALAFSTQSVQITAIDVRHGPHSYSAYSDYGINGYICDVHFRLKRNDASLKFRYHGQVTWTHDDDENLNLKLDCDGHLLLRCEQDWVEGGGIRRVGRCVQSVLMEVMEKLHLREDYAWDETAFARLLWAIPRCITEGDPREGYGAIHWLLGEGVSGSSLD
ncbi:uncharacterized protein EV422DRAFT_527946, partial [Fimicolochytrium jonesii]|uniref:uncharacterized protein n=1 Tax=Fimicolochytrium jonesii TaxID=1396493 RepID=UPI0022FDDFE4